MFEYIERNALLAKINENPAEKNGERCAQILEAILEAPTADVEPVKHGKWYWEYDAVLDDYDYHCCSCGKNFAVKEKLEKLPNYCPNCGAKMDGKEVQE